MTAAIVVIVAIALVAVGLLFYRRRGSGDGVDSFRRQIDALSPEARRPVVDQVQSAAESNEAPTDTDPDSASGEDPVDPEPT